MKSHTPLFVVLATSVSVGLPALAQNAPFKLPPTPKPPSYLKPIKPLKFPYKVPQIKSTYKSPFAKNDKSDFLKSTASSKTGKLKPGEKIVSLNSASSTELVRVPGIGPKTAENIIRYRTEIGPFSSLEDLLKIKGIGEKTLEKLRPFMTL